MQRPGYEQCLLLPPESIVQREKKKSLLFSTTRLAVECLLESEQLQFLLFVYTSSVVTMGRKMHG